MKRGEIVLAGIADAVPVACGMIASVCAAMTAYQIGFSLVPLILFCVFSALLLSFWMNVPRYGFGFGALFLTCVIMLCAFRMQRIGEGAVTCVYRLLDTMPESLKKLFDMEALANTAAQIEDPESALTLFLMVVAAVNGVILAFSLIRSKTVLLPLLIPLPMLLASLVYTNLQPAIWTMLLTCVYFGYALLGNGLRKGETPGRGALFVCLAPALLALGLILLAIFPQKNFDPVPADARRNWLADRISPITDTVMSWVGVRNPKNVDLANTGDRENDDTELFTVYARRGTYLLRTHSYGAYKNSRWRAAQRYGGEWDSMKALGDRQGTADGVMWVLNAMSNERVAPYAWTDEPVSSDPDEQTGIPQAEEYFIRSGGWRDYGWRYASRYAVKPKNVTEAERRYYTDFAMKQYVMPDGEEKQALLAIAKRAGIKKSDDALKTANAVAAFVRDSGVYTLTPGKMPKGKDFVQYFLTESHEGYCVHFASATTALLQALDCPARYTVGYYVEVPAEMNLAEMPVTQNAAHAWTEVYVLGIGWVPIESTPGRASDRESGTGTANPLGTATALPTLQPTVTPTTAPTPEPTPASETAEPTAAPSTPEPTNAPEPHAEPTQKPSDPAQSTGTGDDPAQSVKKRGGAWWILIPLVPLVWTGVGIVVRKRREARFQNANVRRSIPDMAQYLKKLERFGIPEDPDAEEWALEAAFSNHKMKTEHKTLIKRVHTAQHTLYTGNRVRGFLLRWVLFVI